MKIKKFDSFLIKESFNPYLGYYNASNGNIEQLVKILSEKEIEHTYDPYHNVVKITSDDYTTVSNALKDSLIFKDDGSVDIFDPNDCVIFSAKTPPYCPPGAYF